MPSICLSGKYGEREKKSISIGGILGKYLLLSVLLLMPVFSFSQSLTPLPVPETMPTDITLNGFMLHVAKWIKVEFNPRGPIFYASGIAWTSWPCGVDPGFYPFKVSFRITIRPRNFIMWQGALFETWVMIAEIEILAHLEYRISGFRLIIRSIFIKQNGTFVDAELEFPNSIVEPGSGRPAHISLNNLAMDSRCEFQEILNNYAFGKWAIGNTGILIEGTGMIVDLSTSWNAPEASKPPEWRGVILMSGETQTLPESSEIPVSNTGFLQGPYFFANALIDFKGFQGQLKQQAKTFSYELLQPYGYRVEFNNAELVLKNSKVSFGKLGNGFIYLPKQAVSDESDNVIITEFEDINVNSDLDLNGTVSFKHKELAWGHLYNEDKLKVYIGRDWEDKGYFYTSGTFRKSLWPTDSTEIEQLCSSFTEGISDLPQVIHDKRIQGLTLFNIEELQINTLDTPDKDPLLFHLPATKTIDNWLNVSSLGINAYFADLGARKTDQNSSKPLELGPNYKQQYYVGGIPFQPHLQPHQSYVYHLKIGFVSSAVVYSDMSGTAKLNAGVNSAIDYTGINFTSTAHMVAGKVPLSSPLPLEHWGLQVVRRPGTDSAGVISIKTGQILLTAAGLQEERHFEEPFYLNWGEILADGNIGRLFFDYHMPGQKFDGFPYIASVVKLSPYLEKDAYLQTGGMAHLDFFGAQYLNIQDKKSSLNDPPYNGREINLNGMPDPPTGLLSTNFSLKSNWSDVLSDMDFTIQYDVQDQDGFIGNGTMGIIGILGNVTSSINIMRNLICMSVRENSNHDLSIGPIANFGLASRLSGCACVEAGEIKRAHFRADLGEASDIFVVSRAATNGYIEITLSPSTAEYIIGGDLYINLLSSSDIQVNGCARFTIGRDSSSLDGDIEGRFNFDEALGAASLSADGRINWHLAPGSYSLQGRLSVSVVFQDTGIGVEGGLYIGRNAPLDQAWILDDPQENLNLVLPLSLTGIYGYVRYTKSFGGWLISGGGDASVGLGGFSITPDPFVPLSIVGYMYAKIWGDILGGLVSASAQGGWAVSSYPFSFGGDLVLEGCALFECASVTVECGLNSGGFYFNF